MSAVTTTRGKNGASARQAASKTFTIDESKSDLIRRRAYEIFLARDGGPGDHVSDWLQAEQELNGASHDRDVVTRSRGLSGGVVRGGFASQPIRDGVLDGR